MPDAFDKFLADIDFEELKVARPSKVIFLCGGAQGVDPDTKAYNLRDYLLRHRNIQKQVKASFILAESAQQLYRDTDYPDLISFEEDIAQISGNVLVISESAGSLAELGAFTSNESIRPAVRVIISEHDFVQESFVRFGPIERLRNDNEAFVGVFPWRSHRSSGHIVKSSVKPIYPDIRQFVNDQIDAISATSKYADLGRSKIFYDIFWITSISPIISPTLLYELVKRMNAGVSDNEIRNKFFCMEVVGWMGTVHYSNRNYYYCKIDKDPFEYHFVEGAELKDSQRHKREIQKFVKSRDNAPQTAYQRAIDARGQFS